MTRFAALLEKYQDSEETPEEAEELATLLRGDDARSRQLYDVIMLEADLYESYAGIAQAGSVRGSARQGGFRKVALALAAAAFLLLGLAVALLSGRPAPEKPREVVPIAPRPPEPKPERRPSKGHEEREHEDHEKLNEAEREYQKGLKEVERKRLEGKTEEAEKKLREIERERDKKGRERERRTEDR